MSDPAKSKKAIQVVGTSPGRFKVAGKNIIAPNRYRKGQQKRTYAERERDLATIAKLYLKGFSYYDIIEEIEKQTGNRFAISQISYDIKTIYQRWLNSSLMDMHEAKLRELAKLDNLESAYWTAWERSINDIEEHQIEEMKTEVALGATNVKRPETAMTYVGSGNGNDIAESKMVPQYHKIKTFDRTLGTVGDAKFLAGIERCIEMRCKILGLFAPKTVDINWRKKAQEEGLNPEDIVDALTEVIISKAEDAESTPLDGGSDTGGVGRGLQED